jgi:hypothetical protein
MLSSYIYGDLASFVILGNNVKGKIGLKRPNKCLEAKKESYWRIAGRGKFNFQRRRRGEKDKFWTINMWRPLVMDVMYEPPDTEIPGFCYRTFQQISCSSNSVQPAPISSQL